MGKRSLQEDPLLTAALYLSVESDRWLKSDLFEATALLVPEEQFEDYVVQRALRRFKDNNWLAAEPDTTPHKGRRLTYALTEEVGAPVAVAAAGRELAAGRMYSLGVLTAFGQTALGQKLIPVLGQSSAEQFAAFDY